MYTILTFVIILWIHQTLSTVVGVSYLDDYNFYKSKKLKAGEDPCNPLYWYPRPLPEHCFVSTPAPRPAAVVVSGPIPVPIPMQPLPVPVIPPMPVAPAMLLPPPNHILKGGPLDFPLYSMPHLVPPNLGQPRLLNDVEPPKPIPFGMSLVPAVPQTLISPYPQSISYKPNTFYLQNNPYVNPSNRYLSPNIPYEMQNMYSRQQVGMVPGLPGVVSPDGGINILPFSDAYADIFERLKQKMITKQLKGRLRDYERYPWERWSKKRRKRLYS